MTKTELMAIVAAGEAKEAFTHSIYGTFIITDMRAAAASIAERVQVPLYSITDFIRTNRVTEEARILDLPEESWMSDPGICFDSKDGAVMVDGSHRALRREREGKTHMDMWLFPEELMSAFRPMPGWGHKPEHDWGDPIVNGRIVRSGK